MFTHTNPQTHTHTLIHTQTRTYTLIQIHTQEHAYTDKLTNTNTYICYVVIYTFMQHHNDTTTKTQEGRHRKTSLEKYSPLTLLQGFERLACERMLETKHKLHILTPLLWPSRCVLFSWCWGPLHRGFSKAPSVGCGLPYHIWSLAVWNSTGNCFGCGLPYHISSLWKSAGNCSGTQTQLS